MTLLAFAQTKDEEKYSRAELEARLKTVQEMNLDEATRERAVEKVKEEIAALTTEMGNVGVPDDFVEEAKAVTDGHIVFLDRDLAQKDGQPLWAVDLKESVARGITATTVQNRPMHLLRSLSFKLLLMHRDEGEDIESVEDGLSMEYGPMQSLMFQPVGDVLSVEDQGALLMLAVCAGRRATVGRPLAEEAIALLGKAKVQGLDNIGTKEARTDVEVLDAARAARQWAEDLTPSLEASLRLSDLPVEAIGALADKLKLKPLERKRLLAALEEGAEVDSDVKAIQTKAAEEDLAERYQNLRAELKAVQADSTTGPLLESVADAIANDLSDAEVMKQLDKLSDCIRAPRDMLLCGEKCFVKKWVVKK